MQTIAIEAIFGSKDNRKLLARTEAAVAMYIELVYQSSNAGDRHNTQLAVSCSLRTSLVAVGPSIRRPYTRCYIR